MLKTWKLRRSAVVASLAVFSAWILAVTATAAPPAAEKDVPAAASPGAAAIEKAAKDNKYLFIFFFAGQDAHTGAMNGVFQTAMAKMTDRADAMAIYVADPAEKPIVDKFGGPRGSHAAGVGDRSYRGRHPCLSQEVRRGPTPTGVRQPLHGQVHEGHPGPAFDPALRAE